MNKLLLSNILVFMMITSIACKQSVPPTIVTETMQVVTPDEMPTPQEEVPAEVETDFSVAIEYLASFLDVLPDQMKVISAEQVQWTNSCLGLAEPDEICAEMITEGYKLSIQTGEERYELHTDRDMTQFRVRGLSTKEIPDAVQLARESLATQWKVDPKEITLLSFSATQWPDSCLGVEEPDKMCAQVITPGYDARFWFFGRVYIFHTDETGKNIVLFQNPESEPGMENVLMVLDENVESCVSSMFSDHSITTGPCGGEMISHHFIFERRPIEINWYADTYAPFEFITASGKLRFEGRGSQAANPAEQESIYKWAVVAKKEAISAQYSADTGLLAVINQSGGLAGICTHSMINQNGWVLTVSCKGNEQNPSWSHLTGDQLTDLFALSSRLGKVSTEICVPENAVDGLIYKVQFYGAGTEQPSQADYQKIITLIQ